MQKMIHEGYSTKQRTCTIQNRQCYKKQRRATELLQIKGDKGSKNKVTMKDSIGIIVKICI